MRRPRRRRTLPPFASSVTRRRDAAADLGVAAPPRVGSRQRLREDTFAVIPDRFVPVPDEVALPSALSSRTRARSCSRPAPGRRPSCPVRDLSYQELQALWLPRGVLLDPWQVLAAINKIESNFGRNMGPSSAGAVGWMQFMPDTWLRWGLDGNGTRIADPWNPDDAISAAARSSQRRTGAPTSPARSSPTTMRSGTWTTCSSSPPFGGDLATLTSSSRSTRWLSPLGRRRSRWPCSPSSSRRPSRPRLRQRRGRSG